MKKTFLILEDGNVYKGVSFGAIGEAIGEVCFNTGMTGYQEILTDPSYSQQIVTMAFPHIGNYGINKDDTESSKIQVAGFIIKEETSIPSSWRSEKSIGEYLNENNIVGIKNVDTRSITRHIRDNGSMNGIISSTDTNLDSLKSKLVKSPSMSGLDLVKKVTCKSAYVFKNDNSKTYRVAAIDFGIKTNILRQLRRYDCNIKVFPANTSYGELLTFSPDGVFLSNGPGDPSAVSYGIKLVKKLLGKYPIFGICLGHQILALALGAITFKLKFGHRGINHPVKNLKTGLIEITSQNHGFAVDLKSLPNNVESTHINLNDNTSAGIESESLKAFSVQYHPEASPGPHDSRYLFKKFISLMKNAKK
jgi:carbamoyl-phosphate synthase small subunit